jgi:sugar lactone lactonase YvrE
VRHYRVSLAFSALLVFAGHSMAQVITTVAGTTFSFPALPLAAVNAPLGNVSAVATDTKGNLYVADSDNSLVLRITPDGTLSVVAGNGTAGSSGDGGSATGASLNTPAGLAVDSAGNLYIAETSSHRIRKVSNGVIMTFAGNGMADFTGDGGPATNASLRYPQGVAVDSAGNVYIADTANNLIRKVSGGVITTFVGNGTTVSSDGVAPTATGLNGPAGLAVDSANNLYIADLSNHRIRKVTGNTITTVAGNGIFDTTGDAGPATSAAIGNPASVAVDSAGNLYIGDISSAKLVRKVSNGIITTIAGNYTNAFSGDFGPATQASLNGPAGIAVDAVGNVYIADLYNDRVRKVSGGVIVSVAGNGGFRFGGDGEKATSAFLNAPAGLAFDSAGSLYIADVNNNRIRKVSNGIITTVAGSGLAELSGDQGPATAAGLSAPRGVALDSAGVLYIADTQNGQIRTVTGGTIATFAGMGQYGVLGDQGPAFNSFLSQPSGVAIDSA